MSFLSARFQHTYLCYLKQYIQTRFAWPERICYRAFPWIIRSLSPLDIHGRIRPQGVPGVQETGRGPKTKMQQTGGSMVWIVFFFLAGIGLGTILGSRKGLMRRMSQFSEVLVFVLLFVLGAAIGSNAQIMSNIWSLGWEGLLLALGAIAGSLIGAKPVERFISGDEGER
ncbi:MAG: LysO family transporter [Desulfovermiculus sp.]|nr:LysO family transporter [Desulfovermiculus sp.]